MWTATLELSSKALAMFAIDRDAIGAIEGHRRVRGRTRRHADLSLSREATEKLPL